MITLDKIRLTGLLTRSPVFGGASACEPCNELPGSRDVGANPKKESSDDPR
jgi:hypothetical protein